MSKEVVWTCDRCGTKHPSLYQPTGWTAVDLQVMRNLPHGQAEAYEGALDLCPGCTEQLGRHLPEVLADLLHEDWDIQQSLTPEEEPTDQKEDTP